MKTVIVVISTYNGAKYIERQLNSIFNQVNVGFAKSFWLGLSRCGEADYYAFADQDDVWKPNKLICCINAMQEENQIPQLAYCKMQRSDVQFNRLDEQVEILKHTIMVLQQLLIKVQKNLCADCGRK